ncbi:MAG: toll/interleukin-1 receptor domain-containing protein [Anaerolineae bacterium]|nr:toll/interleukin-1 receptor domain-containing protein [Anaerolineae bacterium]
MTLLFISYSSKDRPFALRLAESLRKSGYDVWIDRWNITGREPYWDEIQHGIESATHFLFLISPESIASDSGARRELYHAGGLKPTPVIIPILVKATPFEDFPILISPGQYQIHDFVKQPWETAYEQVLTAIKTGERDASNPILDRVAGVLTELQAEDDPDSVMQGRSTRMKKRDSMPKAPKIPMAPEPVAEPKGRSPLIFVTIAVVAIIVIGGILLFLSSGNPQVAALPTSTDVPATATSTSTVTPLPLTNTPAPTATTPPTATIPPTAPRATATTGPTRQAPSPTPAQPPDISMFYNDTQILLINVSKRPLDIAKLVFVQGSEENRSSFSATQWSSTNLQAQGGCNQVARAEVPLPQPMRDCRRAAWFPARASQQFWIPRDPAATTFKVFWDKNEIQTCDIKTGQCDLDLP